jgi:hypothetical protein
MIEINGKEVDVKTIVIDGVDRRDYPDLCDAYAAEASFVNGPTLTEEEMGILSDEHRDVIHELAHESLH